MASTKSKILTLLEENRGQTLSGSDIAKKLNISRSAVWKGIEELRKEGYEIHAATNRGYSLAESSDLLSAEGISLWLTNPAITKDSIHIYKSIGSTNQEAKKAAVAGAGHGTVILAEEQTEGRGRRGRSFFSPKGTGIYMSVILRPQGTAEEAVLTTTAAAVAVSRAISRVLEIETRIKWVNDIFVGDQKVCGILTEAVSDFQTGTIESLILGIGVNVTTGKESFPDDIRKTAGSLLPTQASVSRNRLAAAILDELFKLVDCLDSEDIMDEYRARNFVPGKQITVHCGNEIYDAKALDIDPQGGLVIQKSDGSIHTLRSGEVTIRTK
jgi:BirA family biotin operon repressor/biotin-[acetyl-CoA-carboxylase] ligase